MGKIITWHGVDLRWAYSDLLKGIQRRTGCAHQAGDVLHDALLRLALTVARNPVAQPHAYLRTVVGTVMADRYRDNARWVSLPDYDDWSGEDRADDLSRVREEAARWFARMRDAEADDPERGRFEAWLVSDPARVTTGQGLSRLLNMTDGLLGQGLKVMILITTNEPLRAMHPAVIRPGRCLNEMEFGTLSAGQANRWLRERGSKAQVLGSATLAQLYSMLG